MTDVKDVFKFTKSEWRSNEAVVLEAELTASPPWRVADYLRDRAEKLESTYSDTADEKLEIALLERGEPLIDIALAQWGMYDEPLRTLWQRPRPETGKSAIHLALLSNKLTARHAWWFPTDLFGERNDYDQIADLSEDEMHALFTNPELGHDVITDFLAGEKVWDKLDEERRPAAVAALGQRLWAHGEFGDYHDGYGSYRHSSVYNNAWKLAERVPVTDKWAHVLGPIYSRLKPSTFNFDDPLGVAGRWLQSPEKEAKELEKGRLSSHQKVRMGLARLAASDGRKKAEELCEADDVVLRIGAYSVMELTPEQITEFGAKDGEAAVYAMMDNEHIWRKADRRDALRSACWAVPDPNSNMSLPSTFRGRSEHVEKEHPEWFRDEEQPPDRQGHAPAPAPSTNIQKLEAAVQQQRLLIWALIFGVAILIFRGG